MHFPEKVNVIEVGPRDGLQNAETKLSKENKANLINMCIEAGYKIIEIGSFVHPDAIPNLADTEETFSLVEKRSNVEFRALVTNKIGVERAIKAGVDKIKLTVSVSKSHNMNNFNRKPKDTLKSFEECKALAKKHGLKVSGAISTAFGCPFEGHISINQVRNIIDQYLALNINELSLSDTAGMANPREVFNKCTAVLEDYPEVKWNLHLHNTWDMGFANVIAAMQAGIKNFDASFAGLGGCPYAPGATGNICTEDLLQMLHQMNIETDVDLDKSIKVAKQVEKLLGNEVESYLLNAGKIEEIPEKFQME